MEAIIFIVLFYGGIALIGWFFEQIGKWNDERKIRIREEVAQKLLPKTNISNEVIDKYKDKLKQIGYSKQEYSDFWKDVLSDGRKSFRDLVGRCPACNEGDLRVIKGQYGKFLGCSSYPKCKYTKNLETARNEHREKSRQEFIELFNSAYH